MGIPLIPIAASLAPLVPQIVEWVSGGDEKAERTAAAICDVAKRVTGAEDADEAVSTVFLHKDMAKKFQEQMVSFESAMLAQVNETMRHEGASEDPWRRRWRPYWGFISGTAFGAQIFGLIGIGAYVVINRPADAALIISALSGLASALMPTWGMALAVLGVAVWKRSEDKKTAAGLSSGGVVDAVKKWL